MYSEYYEKINNKNPFFVGTVVDNKDPTRNYRVKVRLPQIHSKISDADLPWAARVDRAFRGMFSDTPKADGPGKGKESKNDDKKSKKKTPPKFDHCVPEVGTKVLVLAIQNDVNSLLYLGAVYKKTDYTPTDEKKYLNTYGIYADEEQFIGIDLTGDEENKAIMNFIGDVSVDKVKKVDVKAEKDITVTTKTNIKETAEETITIGANKKVTIQIQKGQSDKEGESNNESGDIIITVNQDGNINIKSTKITLEGEVEIKGKMKVTGDITAEKTITATQDITSKANVSALEVKAKNGAVKLSTHTHGYVPGSIGHDQTEAGTG